METKVNYAIVGFFVLLLSAAFIGGVLWLGSGKQYRKTYDTYLAYMDESVSGLNQNAPVRYRGVEVGLVRRIALDPLHPEQVRLEFGILRGTPIREDTVAVLRVQGLTGIAYVELNGGSRDTPLLKPGPREKYPVIKTGPSLMARLDTALNNLLTNLNTSSERFNALLDEGNRLALKRTLADVATISHDLAGRTRTTELSQLLDRIGRSAEAVEKMANETSRVSASVQQSMPELEGLLGEIRELTVSLRRVSEQLEQNPSALLYGKPPAPPGPGE